MQDVVALLLCYPDVDAIRSAQKDIIEAQTHAAKEATRHEEGLGSRDSPPTRRGARGTPLLEASRVMQVPSLLGKISALADEYTQEKREFDIKTLVSDIREREPDLFT
mmetsp:Transcript_160962/g.285340  ORF Transcript_160962/g.285340 Transcript_160962/m.285340 type:complete len:108 (-) Transcript_160962:78-401(-)